MPDFLWSGSMQMARCCNRRCHKQGQTGSQHLSLSLFLSHTLSVAQNDLPLWTRVCATGRPLASIYQRWAHPEYCLPFWQEANQTNKRTNGEQGGKRGGRENKEEKQWDFFCQPLQSGEQIHTEMKCKVQIKKPENHHLRAAAEIRPLSSFLQSACTSQCKSLSHCIPLWATSATMSPPPALIIFPPSIYLSLPRPLLPPSRPPFFKFVPPLLHYSPWSPLWSPIQLLPPYSPTAQNTFYIHTSEYL